MKAIVRNLRPFAAAVAALLAILVAPVMLAGSTTDPAPTTRAAIQPAPEQDYPAWSLEPATGPGYSGIDWATMEQCWHDRFDGDTDGRPLRAGCTGGEFMAIACHWTVDYPSRYWVEQGCGRIATWSADFGRDWWAGFDDQHPAARWVANLRGGGQP